MTRADMTLFMLTREFRHVGQMRSLDRQLSRVRLGVTAFALWNGVPEKAFWFGA
jgi:hypothetical protein